MSAVTIRVYSHNAVEHEPVSLTLQHADASLTSWASYVCPSPKL